MQIIFKTLAFNPRLKSGLDCLTCAILARQRHRTASRSVRYPWIPFPCRRNFPGPGLHKEAGTASEDDLAAPPRVDHMMEISLGCLPTFSELVLSKQMSSAVERVGTKITSQVRNPKSGPDFAIFSCKSFTLFPFRWALVFKMTCTMMRAGGFGRVVSTSLSMNLKCEPASCQSQ